MKFSYDSDSLERNKLNENYFIDSLSASIFNYTYPIACSLFYSSVHCGNFYI